MYVNVVSFLSQFMGEIYRVILIDLYFSDIMSGHKSKDLEARQYQKYSPQMLKDAMRDVLNKVFSTIDSAKITRYLCKLCVIISSRQNLHII